MDVTDNTEHTGGGEGGDASSGEGTGEVKRLAGSQRGEGTEVDGRRIGVTGLIHADDQVALSLNRANASQTEDGQQS